MSQQRTTLTQHADELEHGVAQGWLTGQETCIDLQDMRMLTDLISQEAAGSREVQAEMCGITGRFQDVLTPLRPHDTPWTVLEALRPLLDAHPSLWPGMALYGLRRQAAS